jgi:tRNA threonylcarbamoyladenosine biosynthesis protein TsaB
MVILALDTTTKAGSCALLRDSRLVTQRGSDPAAAPASRLPGDLMRLLDEAHTALHDVDVFAVAVGPGSFTGLRVGIAIMQGLAFAAAKPLLGISAFEALAAIAAATPAAPRRIAVWVDAWRGEVFAALYEDGVAAGEPLVEHPEALLARLVGQTTMFIGDAAATYHDLIRRTLGADAVIAAPAAPPLAATLGALAASAVAAGHRPPPHAVKPLYVRRPDVELARDTRRVC